MSFPVLVLLYYLAVSLGATSHPDSQWKDNSRVSHTRICALYISHCQLAHRFLRKNDMVDVYMTSCGDMEGDSSG